MTRKTTRAIAIAFVASMVLTLVGPAVAGAAATGDLSVTTEEPTDVAETSATLHGNLTSLGNATSANVSFEYWAEGDADNASTVGAGTTNDTGAFEATATGLEPNTTYVVVARADGSDGSTVTGEEVTFATDDAFDVRTLEPADVTNTSATLRGELVDLGGSENATVWFEYWSQDSGDTTETTKHEVNATGVFEAAIGNLSANETYVYVAYAQPDDGEAEAGDEVTIGESADDEPAEMPFGERLTRYLHELIGSSVDGPPGQTISAWVVANNPGADNRPDHAGPDDERGPPDQASDDGDGENERGPPEHANDGGADDADDGETEEDGDGERGPPEHANNDNGDDEDDDDDETDDDDEDDDGEDD